MVGGVQLSKQLELTVRWQVFSAVKLAFHDADTDIFARILANTFDTRDFLKLFMWQAERHADILGCYKGVRK